MVAAKRIPSAVDRPMVPESPMLGRDGCAVKAVGLLLAIPTTGVAESGTAMLVELLKELGLVLNVAPERTSELVGPLVTKLVLKVVGDVVVEQVVSISGKMAAVVALEDRVENIPGGLGSTVFVIVISV